MSRTHARLRVPALLLLITTFLSVIATATPAEARTVTFGQRVVQEAARHRGQPYSYGAAGPTRFDCSGFTSYVFGRFGRSLPHNAAAQYSDVRHIPRSQMRVGDLVFFGSGGYIYHVGIYAGNGRMWHAPRSGTTVTLAPIYSSNYLVGRL